MANIQKTLDSLQPHVIGIRYLEGVPVVDVVLKENWVVNNESNIKKVKGNNELNYYMFYSEVPEIGIDELLDSVKNTINLNIEHENKQQLLKVKVNELKKLFTESKLEKLKQLRFVFNDNNDADDYLPIDGGVVIDDDVTVNNLNDSLSDGLNDNIGVVLDKITVEDVKTTYNEPSYLDENGNPIILTDEELEMIEEEKRAEVNRRLRKNK
jgi:hypothetical protein